VLTRAFSATFKRRGTELPADDPIGLMREFAEAQDNVKRWRAFIETNGLKTRPLAIGRVQFFRLISSSIIEECYSG